MIDKTENEQSGRRRQLRRITFGVAALILAWNVVDEFRPKWFTAAKAVTIAAQSQMLKVSGPTTVEIGSLLVTLPEGDADIMRFPASQEPWARWQPTTKQWAHIIEGPSRNVLGAIAKEPILMVSASFLIRARGDAVAKTFVCDVRKLKKTGVLPGAVSATSYKMDADFQSFPQVAGELLIPRERRTFLGHDVTFLRVQTGTGSLPGRASLVMLIALTRDVTFELGVRDADIDGVTFWNALAKIEAAIKPMVRRVDGSSLDQSAELVADCDGDLAAQPLKP